MFFKRVSIQFIIKITFFLLLFAGIALNVGNWQQKSLSYLMYPFLVLEHSIVVPIKHWLYWRQGAKDLQVLARRLLKERNELLQKNSALEGQLDYLADCAECMSFKKRYNFDHAISAQVLLKNFSLRGHFFLLDAGSSKGIKKDMVAIYNNNLIGRVSEVYPWYCKVILITDSACHVAAKCCKTGSQGIQSGTNELDSMNLNFVSHLDPIERGELILSHGDGLIFPRGFALGRVSEYYSVGVHKKVIIEPLVDVKNINFCLVIDRDFELKN